MSSIKKQKKIQPGAIIFGGVIVVVVAIAAVLFVNSRQVVAPELNGSEAVDQEPTPTASTAPQEEATVEPEEEAEATPEPTPTAVATPQENEPGPAIVENPSDLTALVSKTFALPPDYVPAGLVAPNVTLDPSKTPSELQLRQEAASATEELFLAAGRAGLPLQLVSAYRSYELQDVLFNSFSASFGEVEANRFSARPGQSEHQTGLAIDVSGTDGVCVLEGCFGSTATGVWVSENASQFGFLVRYPPGLESITGYIYEPWHLRYVGAETAQAIEASGLTLDQYIGDI